MIGCRVEEEEESGRPSQVTGLAKGVDGNTIWCIGNPGGGAFWGMKDRVMQLVQSEARKGMCGFTENHYNKSSVCFTVSFELQFSF